MSKNEIMKIYCNFRNKYNKFKYPKISYIFFFKKVSLFFTVSVAMDIKNI